MSLSAEARRAEENKKSVCMTMAASSMWRCQSAFDFVYSFQAYFCFVESIFQPVA